MVLGSLPSCCASEQSCRNDDTDMREAFWFSLALITYAYAGYPLLLFVLARVRPRPISKSEAYPSVSIIMAARNEGLRLPQKLENLRRLDYPRHLLQIVIASDGSHDETDVILRQQGEQLTTVFLPERVGKALALSAAVKKATGEVLVFLDVRQTVDASAIRELVANLHDLRVGAVSGELLLQDSEGAPSADAIGLYWRIEKTVRRLESISGSVVGVTGAIYATRRELFVDLPPGLLLDDVLVPMRIAKAGKRVIFEPKAIAYDAVFSERGREFSRKVRTLTGNYQLLKLAPWILSRRNPLFFRFVSHKLIRLLVPVFLLCCLVSSLCAGGVFFRIVFCAQVALYSLALLGNLRPPYKRFRVIAVATTFVTLNAAAAVALYNFLLGKDEVWA